MDIPSSERNGGWSARCQFPSQAELIYTNVRKEQLHICTGIISICECTEMKAFLLVALEGESANRAKAPIADDLTLNLNLCW